MYWSDVVLALTLMLCFNASAQGVTETDLESFPDVTTRKDQSAMLTCTIKGLSGSPKDELDSLNIVKVRPEGITPISSFDQIVMNFNDKIYETPVGGSIYKHVMSKEDLGNGRYKYTLIIRKVKVKDSAKFECRMKKGEKESKISARLTVLGHSSEVNEQSEVITQSLSISTVTSVDATAVVQVTTAVPPIAVSTPSLPANNDSDYQSVVTSDPVQLLCDGDSLQTPDEVIWTKDGTDVAKWPRGVPSLSNERYTIHQDRLDISQTLVSDTGLYVCHTYFNETSLDNVTTELVVKDKPSTPAALQVLTVLSRWASFKWEASQDNNDPILYYKLQIKKVMLASWDSSEDFRITGSATNFSLETTSDLQPHKEYQARVAAMNSVGLSGWSNIVSFETEEDIPSIPLVYSATGQTSTTANISWQRPEHPNGVLKDYTVHVEQILTNGSRKLPSSGLGLNTGSNQWKKTFMMRIGNLTPYSQYCVYVTASTEKGRSPKPKTCFNLITDVAAPSAPLLLNVSSNATGVVVVEWLPSEVFNKSLDRYEVQLTDNKTGAIINRTRDVTDMKGEYIPKYTSARLTNITGNTTYTVRVRAATISLFSSPENPKFIYGSLSNPITLHLPDGAYNAGPGTGGQQANMAYIGIGVGLLAVLVLVLLAFVIIKRRRTEADEDLWIEVDDETSSARFDDSEVDSVPVEKWSEHVASLHADSNLKFAQEYELAQEYKYDLVSTPILHADSNLKFAQECEEINIQQDLTCNHSLDAENKAKNRYTNILAYDKTRVVLAPLPGKQKGSDYINANYVGGYDNSRAYIATQGPLPNTIDDFWRLVWDRNSVVIVMITNLYEKGRKKCDQYWPEEVGQEATYGFITVKHLQKTELAFYTVRVFSIRNKGKKNRQERLVYQFHYTDWPDHGVPDYTLPVLSFIKKSHARNKNTSRPIIVHCSAGVGRTGTYIVIQSMMEQIAAKGTVSVYSFLKHIRMQRNYLVQTEDQYVFIHDALFEYISSGGHTEINESDVTAYLEQINTNIDGSTEVDKQFLLATYYSPREHEYESAHKSYNVHKNRSPLLVPVDNKSKVRIPMQPGVEGSDYINASYLHGYYQNEEFIVTQHPLPHTVQDFWRMVWDQNSMTIVMLSHVQDEFGIYWNNKDEILDWEGGNFKVTSIDEQFPLDHAVRDFMLESKQDDYELKTRMFSTTNWIEGNPLGQVFDFIKYVREWHRGHQAGPMIVVDSYGGKMAATFCALMSLLNQLEEERTVDVYSIMKMYHLRRPHVFESKDDMFFIYGAIESMCVKSGDGENNLDKSPSIQLQTFGGSPRSSNYTISQYDKQMSMKKESTI